MVYRFLLNNNKFNEFALFGFCFCQVTHLILGILVFMIECHVVVCIMTKTLQISETHKQVLLQSVKTNVKCSKIIRVYTVYKGKTYLQTQEYNIFF